MIANLYLRLEKPKLKKEQNMSTAVKLLIAIVISLFPAMLVIMLGDEIAETCFYAVLGLGLVVSCIIAVLKSMFSMSNMEKAENELAKKHNKISKTSIDGIKAFVDLWDLDIKVLIEKSLKTIDIPEHLEDLTFKESEKVANYLVNLVNASVGDIAKLKKRYTGEKTKIT